MNMKRKVIAIVGTLMLVAALVPMTIGASPETVTRDLPTSVSASAQFDVTMTVGASFGQVVETLPTGFTYVSCAAGTNIPAGGVSGSAVGQVVTFTFYASATPATFTYKVQAPATAVTGAVFSGVFKSGPTTSETVGGDTTMNVGGGGAATVTRDLPTSVSVSAQFDVTMTLGASFGQVVETLPTGFTYVSCAAGTNIPAGGVSGSAVGQVVTFTFYASATPATFTYKVQAPSTAVTGAVFSGVFKSGPTTSETVGGDTTMDVVTGGVTYTLTMAVSPTAGSGTTTPSVGTHSYAAGTVVTITATAASGYDFSYWSGDASGTSSTTTVTMNADKSVTANFVEEAPAEGGFAWWLYDTYIKPFMIYLSGAL